MVALDAIPSSFVPYSFQMQKDTVTQLICRVKYNELVSENEGEALIKYAKYTDRSESDDEKIYEKVTTYLEQLLE
ncbi:MAG: hypothetical protein LBE76_09630 [Nitrososphaerota archaeon]|nr:hypothetical protein [Nitrososphaerota archaeon]